METQAIHSNEQKLWLKTGIENILDNFDKSHRQKANLVVELSTRWINNIVQEEIADYVKEHNNEKTTKNA